MPTDYEDMPEWVEEDRAWIYKKIEADLEKGEPAVILTDPYLTHYFGSVRNALARLLSYGFAVASAQLADVDVSGFVVSRFDKPRNVVTYFLPDGEDDPARKSEAD